MADADEIDLSQDPLSDLFGPTPALSPLDVPGAMAANANRAQFYNQPTPPDGPEAANAQQQLAAVAKLQQLLLTPGASPQAILQAIQTIISSNNALIEPFINALLRTIRSTNITASQPAHNQPNYWSQQIDLSATVSIAAAVQASPRTVISYTIPPGYLGRIQAYGYDANNGYVYTAGTLAWSLLKNGQGYGVGLTGFTEHRGSMSSPRSVYMILDGDQQDSFQFQVQRIATGTQTDSISMCILGYMAKKRTSAEGTQGAITAF